MRNLTAISRRVVRTYSTSRAAAAQIDWSRDVFTGSPAIAAKVNQLRTWVATSESAYEKYKAAPAPIDFSKAKQSIQDQAFVDQLEAFYKANKPPPEQRSMPEEEVKAAESKLEYAKELDAFNKEFLPVLETELLFQINNRTDYETDLEDVAAGYPQQYEEAEDEIERREWTKDFDDPVYIEIDTSDTALATAK